MSARSKLNSIESKMSEVLLNNEIIHEDVITIINEERNYRELKERIRMMKIQRSDTEKNNLIKDAKRIAIDESIKRNEIINNIKKQEGNDMLRENLILQKIQNMMDIIRIVLLWFINLLIKSQLQVLVLKIC